MDYDQWKSHQNMSILNFDRLYMCFDIQFVLNYAELTDAHIGQNMSIYGHTKLLLTKDIFERDEWF